MSEDQRTRFIHILEQYCDVPETGLTDDLRFREDLGFSSLDFMAFLGDLEDTFDVELDEERIQKMTTVGEAMAYFHELEEAQD